MLLTKVGKNPIKHVEEEADCEKERRMKKKRQDPSKLGGIPPNLKAYSLMSNRGRSQNFQNLNFLHIFVALL